MKNPLKAVLAFVSRQDDRVQFLVKPALAPDREGEVREPVMYGDEVVVDVGQSSNPKTNSLIRGVIRKPQD